MADEQSVASVASMQKAIIPIALFGLAALLRLHNAWVTFPLSGFDGPYHGAYIGAIHWEGRFQLPHWFSNHPPLYYALSALIWRVLPADISAHSTLFALRLLNVGWSLALGAAIWSSARRMFPERTVLGYCALAIALFLPMYMGPSTQLSNQIMSAALSAVTVSLLLRTLDEPTPANALLTGVVAGLGVLTKISVLLVAVAAGGALLARGWKLHGAQLRALTLSLILGASTLAVASPYFIQNIATRGTPIDPRIDIWADLDRSQGKHGRAWGAYTDGNLGALRVPGTFDARARAAVWPVTFTSTWFDLFGTVLDVHHPQAQRMSWWLFGFGASFAAAALAGSVLVLWRAPGRVPCGALALWLLLLLNLGSYVAFTREVATYSALKGIYLSAAVTSLVLFAALSLDQLARSSRVLLGVVACLLASFTLTVVVTFWYGGLAPMRVNPADFYLQSYSDPPTLRAFEYFNGRAPSVKWQPPGNPGTGD